MNGNTKIESLTKKGLSGLDGEEVMHIMNKLLKDGEKLKNDVKSKDFEINLLSQILQEKSVDALKEIFDHLPSKEVLSEEQKQLLLDYSKVSRHVDGYRKFGSCDACENEDGDLLVRFSSPYSNSSTSFIVWLITTPAYRVKNHDLPNAVPVDRLQDKYLNDKPATDANLQKFTTAIYQYMWPYFNRENQISAYENAEMFMESSKHVYRNKDLTFMSFSMQAVEAGIRVKYEFVMKYDPLDILPFEVTADIIQCDGPSLETSPAIKEIIEEMKYKPFIKVLESHAERETSTSSQQQSSEGISSDSLSLNFDMF